MTATEPLVEVAETLEPPRRGERSGLGPVALAGDLLIFSGRVLRELPRMRPYLGEAMRQAGILAAGSVLVLMLVTFLAGSTCGLQMNVIARTFGVDPLSSGFVALCTFREITPFVFGYILAAKVGCGMTAELGAMRVREEVDALEVMAARPIGYLLGARVLAAMIALPLALMLVLASAYVGSYVEIVLRDGNVSPGTYAYIFFQWFRPIDFAFICLKVTLICAFVIMTALYFGDRVRGGPVEVGTATAKAMAINLVTVTLINTTGTLIFWGVQPATPFG